MVADSCLCPTVQNSMLLHPRDQEGVMVSGAKQVQRFVVLLKESLCHCRSCGPECKPIIIYIRVFFVTLRGMGDKACTDMILLSSVETTR